MLGGYGDSAAKTPNLFARLASCGYLGAAKVVMGMLGVRVGPARLTHSNPDPTQTATLREELGALGFFDWVKA